MTSRRMIRVIAAVLLGSGLPLVAVLPGFRWLGPPARAQAAADPALCTSSSHPALAAKISADIQKARRGRVSALPGVP